MDPITQRWQAYSEQQFVGAPARFDPTAAPAACSGGLRVRREYAARDAINSRAWDFFHATPPTAVSTDNLQKSVAPVYMDMNPIASRTNTVKYRMQPEYMPDPPRRAATEADLGVAPPAGAAHAPPATFSTNPYTQRLDPEGGDARNMMRELRGAVTEDNREQTTDTNRWLNERQFYDRWMPPRAAADAASLQAYELLRPKQDDWKANLRASTS